MTQNEMIIKWLTPMGRRINPLQALDKFNCWSLSSRIPEIKKKVKPKGISIGREMVTNKKTKKRYAEYFFK